MPLLPMKSFAFLLIFATGVAGGLFPLRLSRAEGAKRLFDLGNMFAAGVFLEPASSICCPMRAGT